MASKKEAVQAAGPADSVAAQYTHIRSATVALCQHLELEDYVVQSMSDVSPTKWHLAHVTWFFERFVLKEYSKTYDWFNEDFDYVLNSYFYTVGGMYARPDRGHKTYLPEISAETRFKNPWLIERRSPDARFAHWG